MKRLARLVVQRNFAIAIVVSVGLLSGLGLLQLRTMEQEDDILAFLPKDNPEVQLFHELNQKFGSLDLALIGIETEHVFETEFLTRLKALTQTLLETKGLDQVLTLANVVNFKLDEDQGGIITAPMLHRIPTDSVGLANLEQEVMSKDHLVGNLVAKAGNAVLLYCFLANGSDPRSLAATIKDEVAKVFPSQTSHFGGGPFVSTYIYNSTQEDIRRLTPWAVLAVIAIMMLSFRDVRGAGLVLLSTGLGIVISLGLMSALGVRFNIILGSMPVILFAIGSAYGIHVIARYYDHCQQSDSIEAIGRTLLDVGPVVVAAGGTTAAGLLSFVCMDIAPLRTFGLYTAIGILASLALSLTFIPAVLRLLNFQRTNQPSGWLRGSMVRLSLFAHGNRVAVGVGLGVVALIGAVLVGRVDNRMDHSTFFAKNSPPDQAEKFLKQYFGGSQFLQLHIKGDLNSPQVVREVQHLANRMALLEHVSSVQHIGQPLALSNQALVGQRRIPDTRDQLALQYSFVSNDPAAGQLVHRERKESLIHLKLDSNQAAELEPILSTVEEIIQKESIGSYRIVSEDDPGEAMLAQTWKKKRTVSELRAWAKAFGLDWEPTQLQEIEKFLDHPSGTAETEQVAQALTRFLNSEECAVVLDPDRVSVLAEGLASAGAEASEVRLLETIASLLHLPLQDDLVEDLGYSLTGRLRDIWKEKQAQSQAEHLLKRLPSGGMSETERPRFTEGVQMALLDHAEQKQVMVPALSGQGAPIDRLDVAVSGLPVMHRGLSRSVTKNQVYSLAFALSLIVLIMTLLFRSFFSGLLVATPTLLTLLVIYGGMGLFCVRLDIGTSMLASLILGAGVDYAVHLTSAWRADPGEGLFAAVQRAADKTGTAIWTNALMVCAGFFVLTLGQARPLQNVGGLTAAAMLGAALFTFLAIPVLARKRSYRKTPETIGLDNCQTDHPVRNLQQPVMPREPGERS